MAYRLGDYVVYGEIRNVNHYSTTGKLWLRGTSAGSATWLWFNLTGDPNPDLKGKFIRFWANEDYPDSEIFDPSEHEGLVQRQLGTTGTMTAQGWVRMLPCKMNEYLERSRFGEPPPTKWVRYLYLEWYSQNGRMVVEMPGARIEECTYDPSDVHELRVWEDLPHLGLMPDAVDPARGSALGVTVIRRDESGEVQIDEVIVGGESEDEERDSSIPEELAESFEAEAAEIDAMMSKETDEYDEDDEISEFTRLPAKMSSEPFVYELKFDIGKMAAPDSLDDEQVETALKVELGKLAFLNIGIYVCEHFSPRDCYRFLIETVLPQEDRFLEIFRSGLEHHFDTAERCPACMAAEADRER